MNKKIAIKKNSWFFFLLAFVFSGFLNLTAIAAQDTWEAIAPVGFSGTVNNVASFGDYVYLGTSQGVYRSTDRGGNWTQLNTGLTNLNVTAIAIGWVLDQDTFAYIADSGTAIYIATSGGVFKSTLGGNAWSSASNGLTQVDMLDITLDQANAGFGYANSLYAAASGVGNIFRSDDGGDNWSLQNTGIAGESIKAIITEPTYDFASGDIFAITASNKIYSSTVFSIDGATDENWTEKYSGSDVLNGVAVLNPAPGSEFLATEGGILRSDDAGVNWIEKNIGLDDVRINSIASDYLYTTILYAGGYDGVYKSIDGDSDANWTKANLGIGSVNVKKVNTNPTSSTLVYATTDNAIYRLDLSAPGVIPVANDFTAPDAIDDLSGNDVTINSVRLDWSAPGDDGSNGTATTYDLRYSSDTINEGNWDQATPLTGEPVPQVAGTFQNMTVTGLSANTQYYFAIKAVDEADNISPISTILGVHTVDATPPVITNILSGTPLTTSITITWTTDENATSQVQYGATTAYGNSTVEDSARVTNHTVILTGLTSDTFYHFSVISKDASNNIANGTDAVFTTAMPVSSGVGDVDNSGTITTADALLTLRNSTGLSMTSTAWQAGVSTGDVNCDGVSASTDALLILRYSVGLGMGTTAWCVI